jgi:hypothetical protein
VMEPSFSPHGSQEAPLFRKGRRQHIATRHTPSDLLPVARPHRLKILALPKLVPLAVDLASTAMRKPDICQRKGQRENQQDLVKDQI